LGKKKTLLNANAATLLISINYKATSFLVLIIPTPFKYPASCILFHPNMLTSHLFFHTASISFTLSNDQS
jgi:hypothetical protein